LHTLGALTANQIAALETRDIAVLSTDNIASLSSNQIRALNNKQIVALSTLQVSSFNTDTLSVLTTSQFAALETRDVAVLSAESILALTSGQVRALTQGQIGALTATQLYNVNADSIAFLTTSQLSALTGAKISSLNTDSIANLSSVQLKGLTTIQVSSLNTAAIQALSTAQVASLNTAFVRALTTTQIKALETRDVAVLSSASLGALTSAQVGAMSSSQICALTTTQVTQINASYRPTSTPIVLDLDGNGIQTLSVDAGVRFDMLASGQAVQTGWVGSGDGLLVMDRNQDGAINDGAELFGSSTGLSDGTKAVDGFQALAQLDTNHDGVISSADAQFSRLGVWIDGNADGVSGAGEVKSLAQLNITQLSLNAQTGTDTNNGNLLGLTANYQTMDGVSHAAADVWFAVKPIEGNDQASTALPANVSRLAQAIGQFRAEATEGSAIAQKLTDTAKTQASQNNLASTTQMVEAMRMFGAQSSTLANADVGLNANAAGARASSLSASLATDDKTRGKSPLDANASGLFVSKVDKV